jgi:hypothetical protein
VPREKRDHQRKTRADRSQHHSRCRGQDHPVGHGDTYQEAKQEQRQLHHESHQQDQLDIQEKQVRREKELLDQLMELEQQFHHAGGHQLEQPEVKVKEQHQMVIKQFQLLKH